jgi:glutamate N-acetyltransferase/amino-acid N-acetyltransferase
MSQKFYEVPGGVTAPLGYTCNAVQCGIKDPNKLRLDLGLLYSEHPTVTAGTFTTNQVKAAPVRLCQKHLRSKDVRAVIVNSGNANACTGPRGINDARSMAVAAATALQLKPEQVLVGSTGIIGLPMPMERLLPNVADLAKGLKSTQNEAFARSIMTSDTKPKIYSVEVSMGSKKIRIGAVAKGAGMICPNMATMLCYVTTDANIGLADLKRATHHAVDHSFNRISIDGDTSTNDTVIVMANGASGQRKLQAKTPSMQLFTDALEHVLLEMAKMIVRDGERVTKFVEVHVVNAANQVDARKVAETVANSLLVKCSWNGGDPNWGRIMHAIGYSGARIRESDIDIYYDGIPATCHGLVAETPVEKLRAVAAQKEFRICIDLNIGKADYNVYTSDLSQEYVDFNTTEYAAPIP